MKVRVLVYVRPTWQHRDYDRRNGWRGPRLILRWRYLSVKRPDEWDEVEAQWLVDYGRIERRWRPGPWPSERREKPPAPAIAEWLKRRTGR